MENSRSLKANVSRTENPKIYKVKTEVPHGVDRKTSAITIGGKRMFIVCVCDDFTVTLRMWRWYDWPAFAYWAAKHYIFGDKEP